MFVQGSLISLLTLVLICFSFISATSADLPSTGPRPLYKLPTCPVLPSKSVLPPPYPDLVLKAILYGVGTQTWSCGWGSFGSPQPGVGAANVWDVGRLVFEDPGFFRSLNTDALLTGTMTSMAITTYLNPNHQMGTLISQGDSFNFYRRNNDASPGIYFTGTVDENAKPPQNILKDFPVDGMGRRQSDDDLEPLDWLKLKGVGHSQPMEVYRVSTVGGAWRNGGCWGLPVMKRFQYTTLFWFYGPPERDGVTQGKEPKKFCESL